MSPETNNGLSPKPNSKLHAEAGYLLLRPISGVSQFAVDGAPTNNYEVIAGNGFAPLTIIYVLDNLGEIEFEGTRYVVCQKDQVVARVE